MTHCDNTRLRGRIPRQENGRFRGLILAGRPGTGKTDIAMDLIRDLNPKHLVRIPVGNKDSVDFGSFYVPHHHENGEVTVQSPVTINALNVLFKENIGEEYGLLVIDDVTSNTTQIQSSLLELVQFGNVGDQKQLGINVVVVITGNDSEKNTFASEWGDALMGRCNKKNHEPDFQEWTTLKCNRDIHPGVISFLKDNPKHFAPSLTDPELSRPNEKTASPRDHTATGLTLAQEDITNWKPCALYQTLDEYCIASLGPVTGGALASHLRVYKKYPSGEEIYNDPAIWKQLSQADRNLPSAGISCSLSLRSHMLRLAQDAKPKQLPDIASKFILALLAIAGENYELNSYALHSILHDENVSNAVKDAVAEQFTQTTAFQSSHAQNYFKAAAKLKKWSTEVVSK